MEANLIGQICAGGTEEVFQRLRDYLCSRNGTYDYSATGLGWTLLDSSYTVDENNCGINDWFIVYSPGEDGQRDVYHRIRWPVANYIMVDGYLHWNAITHTGTQRYYHHYNIVCDDDGIGTMWIYGNLNQYQVYMKWGTTYYGFYGGLLTNLWYNNEMTTLTEAAPSGSDVVIRLSNLPTDDWEIGKKVYIYDANHIEMVQIKDRDNVLKEVTVDLISSYAIGAKMCCNMPHFIHGHFQHYMNASGHDRVICDKRGLNVQGAITTNKTITVNYMSPDPQNGDYSVTPITINSSASPHGYHGCCENMWSIDNINLVSEDVLTDGVDNYRAFYCSSSAFPVLTKEV